MGDGVVIGHGSRTLALAVNQVGQSDRDPSRQSVWSLEAELVADGLTAHTSFWLGPEGVDVGLNEFFADLEREWRGWDGERRWETMEGGLSLTCTHDGRGTITVAVVLENLSGSDWTAEAALVVESGEELSRLVRDLRRLLAVHW
jgi:Family of unknown function (DUF6228)